MTGMPGRDREQLIEDVKMAFQESAVEQCADDDLFNVHVHTLGDLIEAVQTDYEDTRDVYGEPLADYTARRY